MPRLVGASDDSNTTTATREPNLLIESRMLDTAKAIQAEREWRIITGLNASSAPLLASLVPRDVAITARTQTSKPFPASLVFSVAHLCLGSVFLYGFLLLHLRRAAINRRFGHVGDHGVTDANDVIDDDGP